MSSVLEFDVVVVGAGPAGSTAAEGLARASLRVALLEEHAQIGLPVHCSGLVSPRTLEASGLAGDDWALRRYRQARIWGPGGGTLWVRANSVQAISIDRERFDRTLAERATAAGAVLMLETKAVHFERVDGQLRIQASTPGGSVQLQAPLLIGADGAASRVARWLGRTGRHEVIPAVKADVTFLGQGTDDIEILVGNGVAPGWFGWVIPLAGRRARIGVGASGSLRDRFPEFLDLLQHRFGALSWEGVRRAPIPLGPARDFVDDGVMLVGAAARQTKPTTGGGIYLGIRAAQLAAEVAIQALAEGRTDRRALAAYEGAWQRLEGHEVRVGHWLRQVFRRLPDRELDWIVATAGEPWAQDLIGGLGDIDYPAQLLSALLRGAGRRALALWGRELEQQETGATTPIRQASDPIREAAP